ncbi:S9 family peptidase [Egibacter rhizosphaerae]|uniref:S9 family peptidase n=1 Tax=Egibacter rhizosphaerae TaxID=1670831 RepID=A0A411YJ78_9ACTN|nr:prolyl oligopeptidase family serine peptidase [Egibacter rhizosphaerae]QBI21354.1 S9 family peptidase [Egibacter rhizosphaerae]
MTETQQASGHAAATFPTRTARTRRFTLGRPRSFAVAPDGSRVVFLRSQGGTDPVQRLWVLDVASGRERCVADHQGLVAGDEEEGLPPEERARRERAREQAAGIVRYATDARVERAVLPLAGDAVLVDLSGDDPPRWLRLPGPIVDPRLDPAGERVAWVRDGALWVASIADGQAAELVGDDDHDVTWGLAEFVAAEEMGRTRGFWWSPEGDALAVARVDVAPVSRWHLADPADPASAPTVVRYPAAGTANADVSLAIVDLDGTIRGIDWDRDELPYLAAVRWSRKGPPLAVLQSRDQQRLEIHRLDPRGGTTEALVQHEHQPWGELVAGAPRWLPGERLLTVAEDIRADARRCWVDGRPVTPAWLQIRSVVDADDTALLVTGSADDPSEIGVWRVPIDRDEPARLDRGGGVAQASGTVSVTVRQEARLGDAGVTTEVLPEEGPPVGIADHAEHSELVPNVEMLELGAERLRGALLRPSDPSAHLDPQGRLPVLVDPYGGPHAQRVLRRRDAFLGSQWFAEQGFAVLVVDGRGSPGRGPAWEHAVAGELAAVPLTDQIAGLDAALEAHDDLDGNRVAIRGWSFGGFLAALAVLRRPDRFHAAIAGAPVTEWRLYDTHYTERYLGHPDTAPETYRRNSLLEDAHRLARPLLLIHGLADDNVVAAHTLQLSRALLEHGRSHRVLPLSGVTHMTPQETVTENLLKLQSEFLRESLPRPAE